MIGYQKKYGLFFPEDMPDPLVELKCWKHWKESEYKQGNLTDPWECFWRAIYSLVPPGSFVRHRFSEEHVYDWTTEEFVITWGAASSSKSNDYGLLSVVDWMIDPAETVVILASTGLQMLKLRSYESVLRYFQLIKAYAPWNMPGKLRKTDSAIVLDDDDELGVATDKASIRGVAVAEGTEDEAKAKLRGAHLPYVRLLLDELSQMRPAAMGVRTNMAIGAKDFKLVGLTNPDSFTDLAARFSVPNRPGGFSSLDPDVDFEWRSSYGKVRRHDGLQSPAIKEPDGAKKYPFLLTQERLDQIVKENNGNMDDKEVWTMVRGFPPQQGKKQTLISMTEIMQCGATEGLKWYGGPAVTVLGVDPAFSEEGNRAVMQALEVGLDVNGQLKLSFLDPRLIQVRASSKEPVLAQVGSAIKAYAEELNIPGGLIGVDDSATQSVADFLAHTYRLSVRRFVSNAKASELPIATKDIQKAKDKYHNQITELWAATAAFIRAGQIRSLPMLVASQLSSRPMEEDKRPLRLQSKKAPKRERDTKISDSPDDMDAVAYAIGVVRFYLHLFAGSSKLADKYNAPGLFGRSVSEYRRLAQKHDLDSRAYQQEQAVV